MSITVRCRPVKIVIKSLPRGFVFKIPVRGVSIRDRRKPREWFFNNVHSCFQHIDKRCCFNNSSNFLFAGY